MCGYFEDLQINNQTLILYKKTTIKNNTLFTKLLPLKNLNKLGIAMGATPQFFILKQPHLMQAGVLLFYNIPKVYPLIQIQFLD